MNITNKKQKAMNTWNNMDETQNNMLTIPFAWSQTINQTINQKPNNKPKPNKAKTINQNIYKQ